MWSLAFSKLGARAPLHLLRFLVRRLNQPEHRAEREDRNQLDKTAKALLIVSALIGQLDRKIARLPSSRHRDITGHSPSARRGLCCLPAVHSDANRLSSGEARRPGAEALISDNQTNLLCY